MGRSPSSTSRRRSARDERRHRSRERNREHRRRNRSSSGSFERHRRSRRDRPSFPSPSRDIGHAAVPRRKKYRFDSPPKSRQELEDAARRQSQASALPSSVLLDPMVTRPFREIYIGNIPPLSDVNHLLSFINEALIAVNGTSVPGNACVKGWISSDGHYAFVELRTMEEASNCMQLTGLNYMGYLIRVNRPKTYSEETLDLAPVPTVPTLDPSLLALGLDALKNAREQIVAAADLLEAEKQRIPTDRLCLVDLDDNRTEEDVKNELEAIGPLKHFHFAQGSNLERKVCVFEYEHANHQNECIETFTSKGYNLKFADDAVSQGNITQDYISEHIKTCDVMQPEVPTRAIMLGNIVAQEDLEDDGEYFDIIDDIKCECEECGPVIEVKLPRIPKHMLPEEAEIFDYSSIGFAFVLFKSVEAAAKARKLLGGRKFGNRIVEAHFFSELKFISGDISNPRPNVSKYHSSVYNERILSEPNACADMLQDEEKRLQCNGISTEVQS